MKKSEDLVRDLSKLKDGLVKELMDKKPGSRVKETLKESKFVSFNKSLLQTLIARRFKEETDFDKKKDLIRWPMFSPPLMEGVIEWLRKDIREEVSTRDYIFPSLDAFLSFLGRHGCLKKEKRS